jgi:hypothetical protein
MTSRAATQLHSIINVTFLQHSSFVKFFNGERLNDLTYNFYQIFQESLGVLYNKNNDREKVFKTRAWHIIKLCGACIWQSCLRKQKCRRKVMLPTHENLFGFYSELLTLSVYQNKISNVNETNTPIRGTPF